MDAINNNLQSGELRPLDITVMDKVIPRDVFRGILGRLNAADLQATVNVSRYWNSGCCAISAPIQQNLQNKNF